MPSPCISWQGKKLILGVVIQPRASHDEIVGVTEQGLKIRITAPPVDGKANKHLIKFLARTFKVAPSHITLLSGETSRYKRLAIDNPKTIPPLLQNNACN